MTTVIPIRCWSDDTYSSPPDVSIEQVAALSSQNTLPEPSLDLDALQPSNGTSTFAPIPNYRQNSENTIRSPAPGYSAEDPWNTNANARFAGVPSTSGFDGRGNLPGPQSTIAGSGLPSQWWKKSDSVHVSILGQQGFILNRYTVYQITTEVGFLPVFN